MVFMKGLGHEIMVERTRKGLSQADLAKRVGLSQSALSRIEQERSDPKLSHIVTILKELGMEPNRVLSTDRGESGKPSRQEEEKEPKRNLRDLRVNKGIETDAELRILGYELSKIDPSLSIDGRITQAIKNTKDVLSEIREGLAEKQEHVNIPVELDKKLDTISRSQTEKTYHIVSAIEAYLKKWESEHGNHQLS